MYLVLPPQYLIISNFPVKHALLNKILSGIVPVSDNGNDESNKESNSDETIFCSFPDQVYPHFDDLVFLLVLLNYMASHDYILCFKISNIFFFRIGPLLLCSRGSIIEPIGLRIQFPPQRDLL